VLVEVKAVVIGPAGQGENGLLEIEMLDEASLAQAAGNLLGRFFGLERMDQFHPHQIGDPHFNRQRTTAATTLSAELFLILDPGRRTLNVTPLPCFELHWNLTCLKADLL